MCQYCNFKFEENGDCWDRSKGIYALNMPFGFTSIEQRVSMFVLPGDKNHIRGYNINYEVSAGENIEDMIFDTYIPIKYCPFCGRKLTFPDEEEE